MGNLALHKNANASGFISPFSASMAVNGTLTPTSRWLCNPVPCNLYVDLGAPYWFNRWVVRHMGVVSGWTSPDYNMCDYTLQGSNDGNAWLTIDGVTGNTASVTDRTIEACRFRFVKVQVSKGLRINEKTASIVEFEVYEAPPSSPYLNNLTISSGTLSPAFNKNTYSYTANVNNSVTSITVTPTGEDRYSEITVNGVLVQSGQPSQAINLNVGSNVITVHVAAGIGGTSQDYVINVTRQISEKALLSNLVVNGATISPNFTSKVFSYTASVSYEVASVTVTPTAQNTNDKITVNGVVVASGGTSGPINLNSGSNTIVTTVTEAGGSSNNYTIVITKGSSCYLTNAEVTYRGIGIPTTIVDISMNQIDIYYSLTVPKNASKVQIRPFAEDSSARITVNGQVVPSGYISSEINLSGNITDINIVVGTGVTRNYVISIAKSTV